MKSDHALERAQALPEYQECLDKAKNLLYLVVDEQQGTPDDLPQEKAHRIAQVMVVLHLLNGEDLRIQDAYKHLGFNNLLDLDIPF